MLAECSRCGNSPDIEMDAICVSKTKWGYDEKAPITTVGVIRAVSADTVVDEEKQWRIRLCHNCLLMGYIDHIRRAIYGNRKFLIWAPIVLVGCLVFLLLFLLLTQNSEPSSMIILVVWTPPCIAAIICVLGIPFNAVELWNNGRRLKKAKTFISLPQNHIKDAFNGEAHRILESLENGSMDYFGNFDLPRFSTETRKGRTRGVSFREVNIIVPKE